MFRGLGFRCACFLRLGVPFYGVYVGVPLFGKLPCRAWGSSAYGLEVGVKAFERRI